MSESKKWTPPPNGSPCWIEIPAVDIEACKNFYQSLFPQWQFRPGSRNRPGDPVSHFSFGNSDEINITGGITQASATAAKVDIERNLAVFLYVKDIESTRKAAEKLGGRVTKIVDDGDTGLHAYVTDPEGNRFGIIQTPDDE